MFTQSKIPRCSCESESYRSKPESLSPHPQLEIPISDDTGSASTLGTVGVNIKFPYRAVYRPYRTFKKRLAGPYRFILLGVTQYYCYTQSEYRAESSLKWIFLHCLYRCCSSRLFLTRPFRFSLSIVSALLVD